MRTYFCCLHCFVDELSFPCEPPEPATAYIWGCTFALQLSGIRKNPFLIS